MRLLALVLPLLLLVPTVVASQTYEHNYYVQGQGCSGGGLLIRNCESYFPAPGSSTVTAQASDVSGLTVRLRICHEWTYDDGSHARVRCSQGCSPTYSTAMDYPPSPWNTTYRLLVDLRNGPAACQAAATAGQLRVSFT